MTDAVKDSVPVINTMRELQALAKANPREPVILYVTGKHEDGTNCSTCEKLDAAQSSIFAKHKNSSVLAQVPVTLTKEDFTRFTKEFGLTLDMANGTINGNGVAAPAKTPALLRMEAGADGKLQLKEVIKPTLDPQAFDAALTAAETAAKKPTPAVAAAQPAPAPAPAQPAAKPVVQPVAVAAPAPSQTPAPNQQPKSILPPGFSDQAPAAATASVAATPVPPKPAPAKPAEVKKESAEAPSAGTKPVEATAAVKPTEPKPAPRMGALAISQETLRDIGNAIRDKAGDKAAIAAIEQFYNSTKREGQADMGTPGKLTADEIGTVVQRLQLAVFANQGNVRDAVLKLGEALKVDGIGSPTKSSEAEAKTPAAATVANPRSNAQDHGPGGHP